MFDGSIVQFFGENENYFCGYCKNSNSNCSTGMWAHYLTPQAYQDLIDRGWRRSGRHCYKPTMSHTCCPQYTIRCEALNFKLSKSQKKILKRMHKFLATGHIPNKSKDNCSSADDQEVELMDDSPCTMHIPLPKGSSFDENLDTSIESKSVSCSSKKSASEFTACSATTSSVASPIREVTSSNETQLKPIKNKVQGMDEFRPCRKAKDIRRERRLEKLLNSGVSPVDAFIASLKTQKCEEKTLEDHISEPFSSPPVHRLELRLIPSDLNSAVFSETAEMSYCIYQKYQTTIHHDPIEKRSFNQFVRFLVNSPFQMSTEGSNAVPAFGSFHQQYWLDDKIIAVGVIDILPYCVSSVYLYYDPQYSFLSLGTYAALREIAFTRELHKKHPDLKYYYMGFYIHSCPKMRYKMAYSPSFLLCPETYIFHPIEICTPKLDVCKYQRFEEDHTKGDPNGTVHLNEVLILYQREIMTYEKYRRLNRMAKDEQEVKHYATCVGRKCYTKILLYRK